jgi:hypothetical protein
MRMLKLTVLLGVLVVATSAAHFVAAQGVNFSGKWVIEALGRGGQVQRTILLLNQVGTEVDGTIAARIDAGTGSPSNTEILDGKVENDTLTFYVWTGRDRPVKAHYKGMLSGEEIKFTVTGGASVPGDFGGPGSGGSQSGLRQLTAKRAK